MKSSYEERHVALLSKVEVCIKGIGQIGALDVGLICMLKDFSSLVKKLIGTEGDAFKVRILDEFDNASLESNAPGKILIRLLKISIPQDSRFTLLYKLEPYIEMAMKYIIEFGLYQISLSRRVAQPVSDIRKLVQHLNDFVDKIRQEVKSSKFLSKLSSYNRSSNKNYQELMEYVDYLFACHSRLLVLRVDLSYQKRYSDTTQAEVRRDRKRLFENARSNKLFADMVGGIWKLEHGPEKGFHYHVMLFFDGSKAREDITKASLIGRYWIDVVTKGRGLYFNCNAIKFGYKSCGIGMVHHADAQLREGLRNAVVYLTKTDLYMRLQTEGRGMGKMNRPPPKDPRGRPRIAFSAGG
jgi:hypothetical protein